MSKKSDVGTGLARLLAQVERRHGKGAVMQMDGKNMVRIPVFSTGSVGLDLALGTGGLPRGRIVEVYGPESSGKTTLSLHAVAEIQKTGAVCSFIDAEHAFDATYAAALGVDVGALLVSQPSCGEDGLDLAEMMARSGEVGLVVIDSVAALTPRAEIEAEMGDAQVGLQARLMGKALRKLTAVASETGTTILFINQLRQKIGVMFGSNETTTGGNALKYYASVRLDVRRIGQLKRGDTLIGAKTRVKVAKNKLAPPFRKAEFDLVFGRGVCQAGELVDMGVELGIIEKSGAWYSWDGERLGQGRDNAREVLRADPKRQQALRECVMAASNGTDVVESKAPAALKAA
ncbi:MAG: recombination protein RecA [Myxococcota bacterium]|jgi:recombination protein RecA